MEYLYTVKLNGTVLKTDVHSEDVESVIFRLYKQGIEVIDEVWDDANRIVTLIIEQ